MQTSRPITVTTLIKTIFWISFTNMFISHAFFKYFVFDLERMGYATYLYWFADVLIYFLVLILITSKQYGKYFLNVKLFVLVFSIIIISSVVNSPSVTYSFLSSRILYKFLLLAYAISIYDFSEKTYGKFFRLFFLLAIVNAVSSITQFMLADKLGFSTQQTGGIFGFHGTGTGAIFSIILSCLCLQMLLIERKKKYLFLAILLAMPLITGYAYGALLIMVGALLVTSFMYLKLFNFKKVAKITIISCLILLSTFAIAKKIQLEYAFKAYYSVFTNWDTFTATVIKDHEKGQGFGRIGSVKFGLEQLTKDVPSFLIGKGPGSASYRGYTTGIGNQMLDEYGFRTSSSLMTTFMYEMGVLGLMMPILVFYFLYKKWRKTHIPKNKNRWFKIYYKNIPALLLVYFIGLFYTAVFMNYFLVIFFAVNMSYINHLCKIQNIDKSKKNTEIYRALP